MQHGGEQAREFFVSHRIWRDYIHRAAHLLVSNGMADDSYHILDGDPRHPLLSVAEASAKPELERSQHARNRTAFAGKYDSEAQHDCADAHCGGTAGFGFPVTAHQG